MTTTVDVGPEFREVMRRLLQDARSSAERWGQLVELLDDVPADVYESVRDALRRVDASAWTETERSQVWLQMRSLAARHLRFQDASWSFPEAVAREILALSSAFEPQDPIAKVAWLFSSSPDIPDQPAGDWRVEQETEERARAEAVKSLIDMGGLKLVLQLAAIAEAPWTVGVALADSSSDADAVTIVERAYAENTASLMSVVGAFLLRMGDRRDRSFLVAILGDPRAGSWSPAARAQVLICMPFDEETWTLVDSAAEDVRREYWRQVPITGRGRLDCATLDYIVPRFAANGALTSALAVLGLYCESANPQLVLDTLERAAENAEVEGVRWNELGHAVVSLFEMLQNADVDQDRVAMLEWRLLPFGPGGHGAPRALHRRLRRHPEFFVEVLSFAFRGDGEEPDPNPSEATRALAVRAYELLSWWHTPPGIQDGIMTAAALQAWVASARELARSAGRLTIADEQIGEVLAYAPKGSDDVWPHEAVRDLVEDVKSEAMVRGLDVGVFNSRGVTIRNPTDGGEQERVLASKYDDYAAKLHRWPLTAAVLTGIAEGYRRHGRREDAKARLV